MKKILDLSVTTLATLVIATMAAPSFAAKWEGSLRGDVGATGNQVIFENFQTDSDRSEWNWDFTARLAMYTSCSPCSTYVAASWQGSTHTNHSRGDVIFENRISVKNEYSKVKLGMGLDLFKNHCLAFTMEFGGNYLDASLETNRTLGSEHYSRANTQGAGLYTSIKGAYKLPSTCFLGNAFSVYGKAEVADIIGRQKYEYAPVSGSTQGTLVDLSARYNNIVEVDLEAAIVYAPCFKCWDHMNMTVALGVRTDSLVNVFRHIDNAIPNPAQSAVVSYLSLARPSLFLEVGMKI